MSSEPNPYAPPAALELARPVVVGTGGEWKLEGQSLWVRDGAALPDMCLVSGEAGTGGKRVWLPLSLPPLHKLHGRRIQIRVFRSYRGMAKDISRMIGGPIVGTLAAVVCSEWMIGDSGSSTTASISASLGLMGLGVAYSVAQARKALQIVASRDGWHELQGVHPAAIRQLDEMVAMPNHSSLELEKPSGA